LHPFRRQTAYQVLTARLTIATIATCTGRRHQSNFRFTCKATKTVVMARINRLPPAISRA
jgi:hypothetical protein